MSIGAELKNEIKKYQENKVISDALGYMIIKICTRFSLHPKFFGYSFRDDFVAEAVARCCSHALSKIDLSKQNCNPFSYLTQTAYNVFRQRIKAEKKYAKIKERLKTKYMIEYRPHRTDRRIIP